MRFTKRMDRILKLLALIAAIGVGTALWLTRHELTGGGQWVSNPYRPGDAGAPPSAAPSPYPPPAPSAPSPQDTASAPQPEGVRPEVIRVLTTHRKVVVGQMTPACQRVVDKRGAWKDAAHAVLWPECIDAEGHPLVIQFCSYLKLSSGEWLPSSNTRNAPRCQAELALLREGKIPGVAER